VRRLPHGARREGEEGGVNDFRLFVAITRDIALIAFAIVFIIDTL
jgi:hypothetical protein